MNFRLILLFVLVGMLPAESLLAAKKKDFRGLFGNYRREQYTENEGKSTDFGVDLMLSTLLPVSSIVKSAEVNANDAGDDLRYATYFNVELGLFFTVSYNFEVYTNFGYYTYETRKENTVRTDPALPLFHQFEMEVIPAIFGFKYRMSRSDIVPYVMIGGGISYVRRKAFYDYNEATFNEEFLTILVGQFGLGLEFFIGSNAGIRLEAAAYYQKMPADTFNSGGTPQNFPVFHYQANPFSVRYASGVFFLF